MFGGLSIQFKMPNCTYCKLDVLNMREHLKEFHAEEVTKMSLRSVAPRERLCTYCKKVSMSKLEHLSHLREKHTSEEEYARRTELAGAAKIYDEARRRLAQEPMEAEESPDIPELTRRLMVRMQDLRIEDAISVDSGHASEDDVIVGRWSLPLWKRVKLATLALHWTPETRRYVEAVLEEVRSMEVD